MTTPIYGEILSRHYPNPPYSWKMDENDLSTLQFTGGAVPTQVQLDALWPGVEATMLEEETARQKEVNFQTAYPLQRQQLIMARAQLTGDNAELNTMMEYWDLL